MSGRKFSEHPKAEFWDYEKNGIGPNEVSFNSGKKFWFDCVCGHSFDSRPSDIVREGWCPYCKNKKLCGKCDICFSKSFASVENSKYLSKDEHPDVDPKNILKYSHKKYWFDCYCGHIFEIASNSVSNGKWCRYCSSPPSLLCDDMECDNCHNKSFASSDKAKYWNYDNNDGLTPRDIFKVSGKKYWFNCDCGHIFCIRLDNLKNGGWCQYCCNPPKLLCDDECNACYDKSFASSDKAKYWDNNRNILLPRKVFKNSNDKYWFICDCNHVLNMTLNSISGGNWCVYCAGQRICLSEKCDMCYNKSFATNERAKNWDYSKNKISPRYVFKNTKYKYWFICQQNHSFYSSLDHISKGEWCPNCKNKTEQQILDNFTNYKLSTQTRFDWCRGLETDRYLPFDFLIEEHKIIIECDGPQHFRQISNWDPPEKQQANDKRKMQLANEHGYSVIRILQEDIAGNRIDWIAELATRIEKIIALGEVGNSFIGGDIYNNHRPTFIYNGILVIDDIDWLDYL